MFIIIIIIIKAHERSVLKGKSQKKAGGALDNNGLTQKHQGQLRDKGGNRESDDIQYRP